MYGTNPTLPATAVFSPQAWKARVWSHGSLHLTASLVMRVFESSLLQAMYISERREDEQQSYELDPE